MKKHLDRAMVLLVLAAMLAGLTLSVLRQKDVNYYENRTANRMPALSLTAWLRGEYQDALEDALSDQVPGAERLNRTYHQTTNRYLRTDVLRLSLQVSRGT